MIPTSTEDRIARLQRYYSAINGGKPFFGGLLKRKPVGKYGVPCIGPDGKRYCNIRAAAVALNIETSTLTRWVRYGLKGWSKAGSP